ncbi:intermembrane phospholipid transport protein YdbH family protein [Qipengyuania soli]|uniref:YdbH domain-containing protein n=1 Tax=Qipengyuania soli TaxID=2782568 RepID=A0A7S8F6Z5_9SPHN|nr:YdbH domain-containing protein [Qipengyuania soli]QPD00272.1 YdbH domain-containing protein [Qipengyuania soli]
MERDAEDGQFLDYGGEEIRPRSRLRKKRYAVPSALLAVLFAALIVAWFSRERIANNIIADQLESYGLPATYEIEKIAGTNQVLSNLVIGDPAAPDFTAEKVVVRLRYRLGLPEIGAVLLVKPRIYGTYLDGKLSFGSLDKVIFAESDQPPGLPDLNLTIRDGRGLIESEFGPMGLKLDGSGRLNGGFSGLLAATAPNLSTPNCDARDATAFGRISVASGRPKFQGPIRLATLVCGSDGLSLSDYAVQMNASLDDALANPSLQASIDGGRTRYGEYAAASLSGTVRAQLRDVVSTARYSLAARGAQSPQALAAVLTAEGQLRASKGFERIKVDSAVEGNGIRLGEQSLDALQGLARTGKDTLLAPITRKLANALAAEARGSDLQADVRFRKDGRRISFLAPQAELRGGSGARILSLSRVEIASGGDKPSRFAGNIATGGSNLPRLTGRMERASNGNSLFRLAMERYEAQGSAIAIPRLLVDQASDGALRFAGEIEASGPLPGGRARNLRVPLDGRWAPGGAVAIWTSCTDIGFDELELANLRFDKHRLTLCPPRGRSIFSNGADGMRIAAGATSLDLSGYVGETPIRLSSGPVGFAYPGVMTARQVDVALGPAATASRFRISDLDARIGDNIAGTFTDADVTLAAVPLDIREAWGNWDYTAGTVTIADSAFRLLDRNEPDRFEPLAARGAGLTLKDNVILARAELRHPGTDRLVTIADIRHNLATGAGHANLDVPGLVFDERLQPDQLTPLALGVIANADGTVTGKGRIDWAANGNVTSSGTFGTEGLDFAAAFGPVKGASGTIEFTDLLNLTTAPNQKLRVASINPGIEVLDGEIEFALRDGTLLAVAGGSWPFMGGRLLLRDVDFNFGVSEERRYIFEIVGLEAAQFVAQMELENISATGTFDGTVPIVFDANGNGKIDTGVLISRPPGGNVSYVGELTYKDLSPIANFAFDALKSLNYDQMRVIMEGPLTGEIVTRVRFDGVSQGEGAKSNFVTKQLAKLPLQFRINIRAQFYQLLTSMKALYDPSAVRDPRELGLLSDDGKRLLRRSVTGEEAEPKIEPEDVIPDEPTIQEQESE